MKRRKLQIFLSSTYEELIEYRLEAIEAILRAGHIPAAMEQFTAGDETAWVKIQRWIDESDAFFLMLGGRYGSIEPNSRKSYMHLEYEYALNKGKPFCSLVLSNTFLQKLVEEKKYDHILEQENQQSYQEFKSLVMQKHYAPLDDKKDIHIQILHKVNEWEQREELVGWIRSDAAATPENANELARLSAENWELREKLTDREGKNEKPLDEIIVEVVTGPLSASSAPEKLGFLQRRADFLRGKLVRASLEEKPVLYRKLVDTLVKQLEVTHSQRASQEYQNLHQDVLRELEHIRADSEYTK